MRPVSRLPTGATVALGCNGMAHVSLFSGIGGFDLALERAGIPTVAAVEIDAAARGVIHDRRPATTLLPDVRKVTAHDLRSAGFVPDRGVLSAGWPCQGNSVAGLRGGMDDPRSGLWREVVRLLAETRPRWFIGENVPGLFSTNDGRDFRTVVRDLDELGYGVAWRVLDAQHFGVPQRRRRVFIVGCLGDGAAPVQVLLEPESRPGDPAARRAAGARVAHTLTGGSGSGSHAGRRSEDDVNLVAGSLLANTGDRHVNDAEANRLVVSTLQGGGQRGHRVDAEAAAGGQLVPFDAAQITSPENRVNPQPGDPAAPLAATGQPHVAYALRADPGGTGQGHNVTYVTHSLTAEGHDASEDGTGRETPLVPVGFHFGSNPASEDGLATTLTSRKGDPGAVLAPTLTAGMGSNVGHPGDAGKDAAILSVAEASTAVRRLTPLECERLQGLPDGWTATSNGKAQSDSARYRQLGNAVAVPVVEWIAHRLMATHAVTAEPDHEATA